MKRAFTAFALVVLALAALLELDVAFERADRTIHFTAHAAVGVPDPCAWYGLAPSNVAVNITTATTTQIVALTAGKQVWVCEWTLIINSSATTASTATFEYGTGANCGTGTTPLTGAMGTLNAAAGPGISLINGPYSGATMSTAIGNALCILTAGTTVSLQGQVTYKVQ